MKNSVTVVGVIFGLTLLGCPRSAPPRPAEPSPSTGTAAGGSTVVLDGVRAGVHWSDGDTFRVLDGPSKGAKVRVAGFNTLEDYGPVHRWGSWTPAELYALSIKAGEVAAAGQWTCTSEGEKDSYGRVLARCPDAARALLSQGLAMAFSVSGPSADELLAAQREAQAARRGMWAKGVPAGIVSSVHSSEGSHAYNRVVDTATGEAKKVPHGDVYETCQEVCIGEGDRASCLINVPYEARYGAKKAECLKQGE